MPIYGDLYQNIQWSLTFDLKVVTHLKSASEASYDVINMATIMRNCSLIKAMDCVGMVIFIKHERFFNIISIILSHDGYINALPDFDNELFLDNNILHAKNRRFPINTQLIGHLFRLMAENVIVPPQEYRKLILSKREF